MRMDIKKAKVITEKSVRSNLDKSHKCSDCACQELDSKNFQLSAQCEDCACTHDC